MGRPRRIVQPNLTYNIYSRCADQKDLLKRKDIKELLITVIKETQEKYEFELNAYEIVDNHIHLIIKTLNKIDTISKIMHRFKSVFARRCNKLLGRSGPFWNERFGSKIVEQAKDIINYFKTLILYLANNSVRKGYVKDPRDYEYGSFNYYLIKDYQGKLKIDLHDYFFMLGDTFEECVEALLGARDLEPDNFM